MGLYENYLPTVEAKRQQILDHQRRVEAARREGNEKLAESLEQFILQLKDQLAGMTARLAKLKAKDAMIAAKAGGGDYHAARDVYEETKAQADMIIKAAPLLAPHVVVNGDEVLSTQEPQEFLNHAAEGISSGGVDQRPRSPPNLMIPLLIGLALIALGGRK